MKTLSQSIRQPGRPRNESVRIRIQQAAIDLLIEGGYLTLTCDAIAQRAKTSKATIYRWWPNKAQVVIDAFVEAMSPSLPVYPANTLEEFVSFHVQQFIEAVKGQNGKFLAAILAAAQYVPEVREAYLTHWFRPRRELLYRAMRHLQKSGNLNKNIDLDTVLDVLYGPLFMLLLVQHRRLSSTYAEQLVPCLLHGIYRLEN